MPIGIGWLPFYIDIDGSKWVFTIKYHIDGTVEQYKATLVAKDYT